MLPFRPRQAVLHPLPTPSTLYDAPGEDNGGICSQDIADLDKEFKRAKERERWKTAGVEGQTENDAVILFEDGSGSDAEKSFKSPITSRGQQHATKSARLEEDKVQRTIDRNVKREELQIKRKQEGSWDMEAKTRLQRAMAEQEALDKEVEAQRKAEKEKDKEKRRNVKAEQEPVKERQPLDGLYIFHTPGFAPTGRRPSKGLNARDVLGHLFVYSEKSRPNDPEESTKTVLWHKSLVQRRKDDAPPPVSENEDKDEKLLFDEVDEDENRIFDKVVKGFRAIDKWTARLATDRMCSRRVRLTCEDIHDAVDMWRRELVRLWDQYWLAYGLNQDVMRSSHVSGSEQALNRRVSIRAIRQYDMEEPFNEYLRLAREVFTSLDMLERSRIRWRGVSSGLRLEVLQKYLNFASIDESIHKYFEIARKREDAVYGASHWEVSFWKLVRSMNDTGRMMSKVYAYWKAMGSLHSRQRMLLLRRRIRDDENKMQALLRECVFIGSRRTENSVTAPINPAHVSNHERKDVEEADVGLSDQTPNGSGTLNLYPTSKLGSPCSAMAVESDSDAEVLDDVVDHTSMVYHIPEEVLREAMLASRSTGAAYWQYSLYQEGGDPSGEKVKVHYCTSKETTERIAQLFLDKEVVGFDIEWKPQAQVGEGIKKNVSLIQLASEERIALFHIARYAKGNTIDDLLAPSLKKIMESSEISKVGVSVKADCTRLRRFLGIEASGLLELSHLYKLIKHSAGDVKKINKVLVSLAQQVEEHLQLPMWKGDVRSSDWSQKLNYEQIKCRQTSLLSLYVAYFLPDAASDSYAGLRLYDVMEGKRKTLKPTPPRPAHAELNLPIILAHGKTVATYDEPDELKDEKPTEDVNGHPADVEEMARDFLDIELEDSEIKPSTTSRSAARGSKKSPEFTAAEIWVTNWRSKLPPGYTSRAIPSQLRAYALWSEQGKEVSEVAEILRDPPLQATTVASYILEVIRLEKLPFSDHRLEKVWELLPARAQGRGRRPQGVK